MDPNCGRRTLGTGDEDDDDELTPYVEDGIVFHGTGVPDEEATAEWHSCRTDEDP